ncbi:hypothetical protein K439DRAFT_1664973 [Ramaria rubella]|nr:hypothetical protein K439DRAFT_1664973 [Ramaria rubella]
MPRPRPQPTWAQDDTRLKAEAQYSEPAKQAEGSNTAAEIAAGHALLAMLNAGAGDKEVSRDSPKEMVSEVEKELARDAQALASDTGDNDEDVYEEEEDGSDDTPALVWDMLFQVPTGPRTIDTLKLTSETTWSSAQHQISDKMDISMKQMNLSYKLTTETKGAPARVLNSMAHWLDLLEQAGEEKAGMESTKSRGKKVKVLEVILFNVQGKDKEEKGKHKGKGKKGDMSCLKHKQGRDSDGMSDGDNAGTSSDHAHWVLALQKKYQCDEHAEGHCKVGLGGVHLELKASHLSLWGLLLVSGEILKWSH